MSEISVQNRLVRLENELKAQKTASTLAYSSMLFPENTPVASISGTISTTTLRTPMARLEATFTRSDGRTETPFVDFAYYLEMDSFADWVENIGGTVSGPDKDASNSANTIGYLAEATNGTVKFFIDFSVGIVKEGQSSVSFSIDVQAISPVEGTLTIARTI